MNLIALIFVGCLTWQLCTSQVTIEGDIGLSPETMAIMNKAPNGYDAAVNLKWPNGVVPFVFTGRFDNYRRDMVKKAIQQFNKHTCIKLVPRNNEYNYIYFENTNKGCWSWIGRQRRRNGQLVSIGNGCNNLGTVMHEIMHAIGFFHEQSRLDRDNYVKINWGNIQQGQQYNFQMYSRGEADYLNEPYDIKSLMHYRNREFSRNGYNTIESISNPRMTVGNIQGFSTIDIRQMNKMYNCGNVKPGPVTSSPPNPTGCADVEARCSHWASIGECKNNPTYMLTNCKKSCNKCPGDCKDTSTRCGTFATTKNCQSNDYVIQRCQKSCRKC